jgi:hypothetical protein
LHFKPIKNENGIVRAMECTHAMAVNPGAVPSFVQGMMMKAHRNMLTDLITYMNKHKDRLQNIWSNEVKLIVEQIYQSQRPKAPIIDEIVESTPRKEEPEINTERCLLDEIHLRDKTPEKPVEVKVKHDN